MSLAKDESRRSMEINSQVTAPVVVKSSCCGGSLEEHNHAIRRSESSLEVLGDAVDRLTVKIDRLAGHIDSLLSFILPQEVETRESTDN